MNDNQITLQRLIDARKIAAEIVNIHGEQYLPYLTRLHEEVERRESGLALASKLAS